MSHILLWFKKILPFFLFCWDNVTRATPKKHFQSSHWPQNFHPGLAVWGGTPHHGSVNAASSHPTQNQTQLPPESYASDLSAVRVFVYWIILPMKITLTVRLKGWNSNTKRTGKSVPQKSKISCCVAHFCMGLAGTGRCICIFSCSASSFKGGSCQNYLQLGK